MIKYKVVDSFYPETFSPIPGLHLGTIHDAIKLKNVFSAAISVGVKGSRYEYPTFERELRVNVTDDPFNVRILKIQLMACCKFIKENDGRVLIFCQAGTCRWVYAIASAYIMFAYDVAFHETEYKLDYAFDDAFKSMLIRFKLKCFRSWLDSMPN